MKRNKTGKSRISGLFVLMALLAFFTAGCGKKETETAVPTEAPAIAEDEFRDAEGFVAMHDYVKTKTDNVNLYVKPDQTSDIYVTLNRDVDLLRTGILGLWTRVQLNGSSYYLLSSSVTETEIKWKEEKAAANEGKIIFIDPAKQITEDKDIEPVRPDIEPEFETVEEKRDLDGDGTEETSITKTVTKNKEGMKAKNAPAAKGVISERFEYEVTLEVANLLNAELVRRGYTVIMSRTDSNVRLSNATRAELANQADADLYIRLSAGSVEDVTVTGVMSLITTSTNVNTGTRFQDNYNLGYDLLLQVCEATGVKRVGIYETDDMTSLNYCHMPAVCFQMGFLSNAEDDSRLNDLSQQSVMARALADGIDQYFKEKEE